MTTTRLHALATRIDRAAARQRVTLWVVLIWCIAVATSLASGATPW